MVFLPKLTVLCIMCCCPFPKDGGFRRVLCLGFFFLLSLTGAFAADPWYGSAVINAQSGAYYMVTCSGSNASVQFDHDSGQWGWTAANAPFNWTIGSYTWASNRYILTSGTSTEIRLSDKSPTYSVGNPSTAFGLPSSSFSRQAAVPGGAPSPTPLPASTPLPLEMTEGEYQQGTDGIYSGYAFSVGGDVIGGTVELWIDGQKYAAQYSDNGGYFFFVPQSLLSLPYKVIVGSLQYNPVEPNGEPLMVNAGYVVASGTGTGASLTPSGASSGTNSSVIVTSVGSDGGVTYGTLASSRIVTSSGTNTVYSYQTRAGSNVSYVYSGAGTSALTQDDIRRLQSQLAGDNAQQLDYLKKIAANTAVMAGASPSPSPGASPSATPSSTPENATQQQILDAASSALAGIDTNIDVSNMDGAVGPTSADVIASSESWLIDVPWYGQMDLNPLSYPEIAALASWFRNLMILVLTMWVIIAAYDFLWHFEAWTSLQPFGTTMGVKANVEAWLAAAGASWGVAGVALAVATFVLFVAIAQLVVQVVLGALLTFPTLISTWSSLDFTAFGGVGKTMKMGGGGIFGAVWSHLQQAPAFFMKGLWLIDRFFPLAHMLVCLGNRLTMKAWGTFLLRALATIKRMIPS